jgi:hypothetical protein
MQLCRPHRRHGSPLYSRRRSSAPEPSLKVTHLPAPLIFLSLPCCSRNCSPLWARVVAGPLRRRRVPSGAHAPVSSPQPSPSCHLEPARAIPNTPRPTPACPCPRLRRSSASESGGAAAGSQGELTQACREISTAHLRSSGLDLIRADLILTV